MQHALRILTRVHLGLLYGLGWFVHAIIYHVLRWRRDQVESDVAQAFPAKTADARAEIVRASYRNLADVVVETLWGFTASAEDYSRQHANVTQRDGKPYGDVAGFVDGAYLAGVARLNLATLVHLASAPGTPDRVRLVTDALGNDTTLRWAPTPGADGYEVVWRETTDWRWTHAADAGNATSLTLPLSKDDLFFGVRAYTRRGYRSPVVFDDAGRQ